MTDNKENVHVVVLCDCVDDGCMPLMSQSPMAGWPVWGKSSFADFLMNVASSDAADVSVVYSGHPSFWDQMALTEYPGHVRFVQEEWPAGSAGAVRQALSEAKDGLAVIYTGNRLHSPSVEALVADHTSSRADFSVVVNSDGQAAGIYVCNVAAKEMIPEEGYSDIKEFLIPAIIRRGQVVKALTLSENVGAFSDCKSYMQAVLSRVELIACQTQGLVKRMSMEGASVWASDSQDISDTCLFSGPVVVMPGADIGEHCTVQGPAIIGSNARVRENAMICRSVLWDDACVESDCLITESVIGPNVRLPQGGILSSNETQAGQVELGVSQYMAEKIYNLAPGISRYIQNMQGSVSFGSILSIVALAVCFVWSYRTDLLDLWNVWLRSDEYSSGMLVPVLAGYVLWLRRDSLRQVCMRSSALGLVGLIVAQAFRLFGLMYMYQSAERLSIVMTIGSCVLLLGGKALFKRTFTVLLFLLLMLPWPMRLQNRIALPLQGYATDSAVFCLETLGYDVISEGTVIHIGDTSVAVAEACNGLRMITAFFVIAGLVALIARRPAWEKVMVFLSSLPIALVCNTIRLTVTAIAFTIIKGEASEQIFHDFGGYAMMPLALGIIVFELWIFRLLTVEPEEETMLVIRREPSSTQETAR
jgi:exosortase